MRIYHGSIDMKEQEGWKEAFGSRHFCQTISNNVVTKFPHIEFLKKNLTIFAA